MINPTEEQLKAFHDDIQVFLAEIKEQKKRIQEDLKAITLSSSDIRVCDFGCGCGYSTYCLASILNASQLIGIDSDPVVIHKANNWFKAVKLHKQLSVKEEIPDDILTQEANQILGIVKHPEFLVGNVVLGKDLPSDIDLAYCRRLLVNIGVGNYENNVSSINGCKLAIRNIVKTIKPGGLFVVVEEVQRVDFSQLLEEAGLYYQDKSYFQLGGAIPFYRYTYRKAE